MFSNITVCVSETKSIHHSYFRLRSAKRKQSESSELEWKQKTRKDQMGSCIFC